VEGWDRDEVSVVAEIRERREGDVTFTTESKDGYVEITAEQASARNVVIGFAASNRASFKLKIPKKTFSTLRASNGRIEISQIDDEVDAATSNGLITAEEIGGKARLKTSNGAIKADAIKSELIATTSNGGIEATDINGNAELRTSNGKIEVRGIKGKVDAFTSNGQIRAENVDGDLVGRTSNSRIEIQNVTGAINLTTSNASVKAEGLDGMGKGIRLITSNGSMDISLGRAEGVLEATDDNKGRSISIEIPKTQSVIEGSTLKAQIGNGGQSIELKTSNGRITVR
jgi:hypothetical protein